MLKNISSQPDASLFRSLAVIILVVICLGVFLSYMEDLSRKAEKVAQEVVVNDIKQSLAMMLYDYTIKGQQHELKKFDRDNPFVPLAIYRALPTSYRGVVESLGNAEIRAGWYFEKSSSQVFFVESSGNRTPYQMRYLDGESVKVGQLLLVNLNDGSR